MDCHQKVKCISGPILTQAFGRAVQRWKYRRKRLTLANPEYVSKYLRGRAGLSQINRADNLGLRRSSLPVHLLHSQLGELRDYCIPSCRREHNPLRTTRPKRVLKKFSSRRVVLRWMTYHRLIFYPFQCRWLHCFADSVHNSSRKFALAISHPKTGSLHKYLVLEAGLSELLLEDLKLTRQAQW
jgi:hypothetical protein